MEVMDRKNKKVTRNKIEKMKEDILIPYTTRIKLDINSGTTADG